MNFDLQKMTRRLTHGVSNSPKFKPNRKKSAMGLVPQKRIAEEALRTSVIFNLVTLTNKTTTAQSNLLLDKFGIGVAVMYIFTVLKHEPSVLITRLCEVTTVDKSVASRALNFMERHGFVQRKRDGGHATRRVWSITKEGAKFHDGVRVEMKALTAIFLANFSNEDRETLLSLLWRLQENIASVQAYKSTRCYPSLVKRKSRAT